MIETSQSAIACRSFQPLLGCTGHTFGSDDYWRCFVKNMATTFYHFAGTCKMGPASDPFSVVDHNLR